jgi:hypothetical protein
LIHIVIFYINGLNLLTGKCGGRTSLPIVANIQPVFGLQKYNLHFLLAQYGKYVQINANKWPDMGVFSFIFRIFAAHEVCSIQTHQEQGDSA